MATDMFGNILSPEEEERLRLHQQRLGITPNPAASLSLYPNQAPAYGSFGATQSTGPYQTSPFMKWRQEEPITAPFDTSEPAPMYGPGSDPRLGWKFNNDPIALNQALSKPSFTESLNELNQQATGNFTGMPSVFGTGTQVAGGDSSVFSDTNWRDTAIAEAQRVYDASSGTMSDEMDQIDAWKDVTPGYSLSATLRDIVQPSGYTPFPSASYEDYMETEVPTATTEGADPDYSQMAQDWGDPAMVSPTASGLEMVDTTPEVAIPSVNVSTGVGPIIGGEDTQAADFGAGTGFSMGGQGGFTGGSQMFDMGMDPTFANTGGWGGEKTTVDLRPIAAAALPVGAALGLVSKIPAVGKALTVAEKAMRRQLLKGAGGVAALAAAGRLGPAAINRALEVAKTAGVETFAGIRTVPILDKALNTIGLKNVIATGPQAGKQLGKPNMARKTNIKPSDKPPQTPYWAAPVAAPVAVPAGPSAADIALAARALEIQQQQQAEKTAADQTARVRQEVFDMLMSGRDRGEPSARDIDAAIQSMGNEFGGLLSLPGGSQRDFQGGLETGTGAYGFDPNY